MDFFKIPAIAGRLSRLLQLLTDRGQWVRIGTYVLGGFLMFVGAWMLFVKDVGVPVVNSAVDVAKGVA